MAKINNTLKRKDMLPLQKIQKKGIYPVLNKYARITINEFSPNSPYEWDQIGAGFVEVTNAIILIRIPLSRVFGLEATPTIHEAIKNASPERRQALIPLEGWKVLKFHTAKKIECTTTDDGGIGLKAGEFQTLELIPVTDQWEADNNCRYPATDHVIPTEKDFAEAPGLNIISMSLAELSLIREITREDVFTFKLMKKCVGFEAMESKAMGVIMPIHLSNS